MDQSPQSYPGQSPVRLDSETPVESRALRARLQQAQHDVIPRPSESRARISKHIQDPQACNIEDNNIAALNRLIAYLRKLCSQTINAEIANGYDQAVDANLKTIVWTYYKAFFEIPQLPIQSSDDDDDDPLDPIEQAALPRVLDDSVHPSLGDALGPQKGKGKMRQNSQRPREALKLADEPDDDADAELTEAGITKPVRRKRRLDEMRFKEVEAKRVRRFKSMLDERRYEQAYFHLLEGMFPRILGFDVAMRQPPTGGFFDQRSIDLSVRYPINSNRVVMLSWEVKEDLLDRQAIRNQADEQIRDRLRTIAPKARELGVPMVFGVSAIGLNIRFYRAYYNDSDDLIIIPGREDEEVPPGPRNPREAWTMRVTDSFAVKLLEDLRAKTLDLVEGALHESARTFDTTRQVLEKTPGFKKSSLRGPKGEDMSDMRHHNHARTWGLQNDLKMLRTEVNLAFQGENFTTLTPRRPEEGDSGSDAEGEQKGPLLLGSEYVAFDGPAPGEQEIIDKGPQPEKFDEQSTGVEVTEDSSPSAEVDTDEIATQDSEDIIDAATESD